MNDCEESQPGHSALVEMEGDKVQGWICAAQAQEQGDHVGVRYVPYKGGARLGCDGSVDDVGSPSAFTADPHSFSLRQAVNTTAIIYRVESLPPPVISGPNHQPRLPWFI